MGIWYYLAILLYWPIKYYITIFDQSLGIQIWFGFFILMTGAILLVLSRSLVIGIIGGLALAPYVVLVYVFTKKWIKSRL